MSEMWNLFFDEKDCNLKEWERDGCVCIPIEVWNKFNDENVIMKKTVQKEIKKTLAEIKEQVDQLQRQSDLKDQQIELYEQLIEIYENSREEQQKILNGVYNHLEEPIEVPLPQEQTDGWFRKLFS